jgi:hypothetical protein
MDEEIAEIVEQSGWFPASVSDHEPPFLYSIGLMKTLDHPEFIVFGLDKENAYALTSGLIDEIRGGRSFKDAGVYTVTIGDDEHRVGMRVVHPTQHPLYLGFAMGFCRHIGRIGELQAMQVFWPDEAGRFPFEVGCDLGVFQLQPRLDIGLTPREIRDFERQWE